MHLINKLFLPTNVLRAVVSIVFLATTIEVVQASHHEASKNELNEAHQEEQTITLSAEQLKLAGISVSTLDNQNFSLQAVATAQLLVDKDKTMTIAPQLTMQVIKRHVVPGELVTKGQPLLTLGGADIASAQADYIIAATEWDRIKRMSAGTISASQRMQTEVNAELKRAILQSIMMTNQQIVGLVSTPKSIGQFQLLAPIQGRVQQDIVMLGQVLEAGTALMQLTDESFLWVQAELTPTQADQINIGSEALVRIGKQTRRGTLIGRSHEINSITRTEQVLVQLPNPKHDLHAGEFAELYLAAKQHVARGYLVPDAALTRSGDGDWQVFVEHNNRFSAKEVQVIERQRGLSMITGVTPQTRVVVSGVFFLASEQAKSGFDIHNH
ncbi:efflux RND transporter periplasmic adaptor subunit [Shewanella sp. A14]